MPHPLPSGVSSPKGWDGGGGEGATWATSQAHGVWKRNDGGGGWEREEGMKQGKREETSGRRGRKRMQCSGSIDFFAIRRCEEEQRFAFERIRTTKGCARSMKQIHVRSPRGTPRFESCARDWTCPRSDACGSCKRNGPIRARVRGSIPRSCAPIPRPGLSSTWFERAKREYHVASSRTVL